MKELGNIKKMARENAAPSGPQFVGDYVNDFAAVVRGALFAGVHANFISGPGTGKTEMLEDILSRVYPGNWRKTEFHPSTPPAVVKGSIDPRAYMEKGDVFTLNTDNTPYDANLKAIIFDEFSRASDVTFDAAITSLSGQKNCQIFSTNNFVPAGERIEALLDRFALYHWIEIGEIEVDAAVESTLTAIAERNSGKPAARKRVPAWFPTAEEIETVQNSVPGPNAIKAVQEFINSVREIAVHEPEFKALKNYRSPVQWTKVIYFNSVAWTGNPDFEKVPEEAAYLMRFLYPARNYAEAKKWANIVESITHRVRAEVNRVLSEFAVDFKRVAQIKDRDERMTQLGPIMIEVSNAQVNLESQFGDSEPEVMEGLNKLNRWVSKVARGDSTDFEV